MLDRVPAGNVLVAVSGGKDSLCTLDVCVRRFGAKRVTGFLMELVKGLDCEWQYVRQLEKRFGIKVVGVPHYELSRLLKYSAMRPATLGAESIKILKQSDTEDYLRRTTGVEWIAWGMRASDSIVRNAYLKRIQGIDTGQRRVYPIWTWKKADVYGYLHARKLPVPQVTGGSKNFTGGVSLDPQVLSWIKAEYPQDFAKILKVFPYAGAAVFRFEQMKIDPVAEAKAAHKAKLVQARKKAAERTAAEG